MVRFEIIRRAGAARSTSVHRFTLGRAGSTVAAAFMALFMIVALVFALVIGYVIVGLLTAAFAAIVLMAIVKRGFGVLRK